MVIEAFLDLGGYGGWMLWRLVRSDGAGVSTVLVHDDH